MKNKKSLGQHWLKNRTILNEIADLASDDSAKLCVEIGPGLGTLTASLLKKFPAVLAIEFDQRLATNLPHSFPSKNLEVINADILKFNFDSINQPYVVAGNIPYYITSPIIERLLTVRPHPNKIVLLIQKEVAERILDKKETVLSLFIKNYSIPNAGPIVPRSEFTPPPKVDSQVIILKPLDQPKLSTEVFSLIRQGFIAPRKKLIHNLSNLKSRTDLQKIFSQIQLDLNSRAGDLSLDDWGNLYKALNKNLPRG